MFKQEVVPFSRTRSDEGQGHARLLPGPRENVERGRLDVRSLCRGKDGDSIIWLIERREPPLEVALLGKRTNTLQPSCWTVQS